MSRQLTVQVTWSVFTKRFVVDVEASTTNGAWHGSTVAEDALGNPMTDELASAIMQYVAMAIEQQYPF